MAVEWNVTVFDKPGADRTPSRGEHLKGLAPLVNAGVLTSAGAIYHDVEKTKFAGSNLHIIANTKEDVIEVLKKDPFHAAGVWDVESAIIHPVGIAVRLPKKMDGVTLDYNKL